MKEEQKSCQFNDGKFFDELVIIKHLTFNFIGLLHSLSLVIVRDNYFNDAEAIKLNFILMNQLSENSFLEDFCTFKLIWNKFKIADSDFMFMR